MKKAITLNARFLRRVRLLSVFVVVFSYMFLYSTVQEAQGDSKKEIQNNSLSVEVETGEKFNEKKPGELARN